MQQAPLLQTKLYIPPMRPEQVSRPRLIERLNAALPTREAFPRALTLVSAPAGFGKTTLVSEWVRVLDRAAPPSAIAWLSLDRGDNDPARFLAYLIAALRLIEARMASGMLSALQSPEPPPAADILTILINEVAGQTDTPESKQSRIVLVLDDYHLIEAQEIHDALAFLLEHLPPQMHLVIATRDDPHLPFARLRAQGQLTELRAADLRFTPSEATQFLNQAMGLDLSVEDIAALEARTEGWIAGLHLAAISMQGHKDTSGFIKSFTGSHRFVLDYLIEEVLEQQPEGIQTFLLRTSILERMNGSLCDRVAGNLEDRGTVSPPGFPLSRFPDSQSVLEHLDHTNLFIVPLDEERRWYRYHHLFADLLRQRLHQTQPDWIPRLHHRASHWYELNGLADEAIDHALAAEDSERAARLLEEQVDATWQAGEHSKLWHWLEALPDEAVLSSPNLCIFRARILFARGQQDAAEHSLQAAERALGFDTADPRRTSPVEQNEPGSMDRRKLQGRIAVTRALVAFFRGDLPGIVDYSREALRYLPEEDTAWRTSAAIALGDAHRIEGDIEAAYRARLSALEISRAAGNVYMILIATMKLAVTMRQLGQLEQVKELCQQQLQLAKESGLSHTAVAGGFSAIRGEVLAELGALDEALPLAQEGVKTAECGDDMVVLGWSYLCLMRVLMTCGDTVGAEKLLRRIGSSTQQTDIPPWIAQMLAGWQVRLWLAQGNLESASRWMAERDADLDGELQFLSDFEDTVLARVLMAQDRLEESVTLLQRLLEAAETGGRISSLVEILILQSLAFQVQGDMDRALSALEKALHHAEPGGFIHAFVDEGPPLARLLYEAASRDTAPGYARRLLAAFPVSEAEPAHPAPAEGSEPDLIEPLSERELEVLGLVAEGLTNREIASRLYLSLNTVKGHTRNIYGKLGVHSRMQAVTKARSLGVLPAT